MTPDEMTELVDLYVAGELPAMLETFVKTHLAADTEAAHDAQTLSRALELLHQASEERPDDWFVERLLNTLLREQSAAQPLAINQ